MPVDVSSALDLRLNHHLSYAEIAAIQEVSPQAIHQKIKNLLPPAELDTYKNHRADILAGIQARLLRAVDDDRLDKTPVGSLVLAACQLYDKERLERGMSTSNMAMIHADIEAIRQHKPSDPVQSASVAPSSPQVPIPLDHSDIKDLQG